MRERVLQDLRIIVTGGTLDKVHDTFTESLSFASEEQTHIPDMLVTGRCYFPTVQQLFLKDSLEFNDKDRDAIAKAILSAPEHAIVVTHGTGTMEQTAHFLVGKNCGKTVVLTGALRPHSFGNSDALFNLGGAIIAAQTLHQGIWAIMNGRIFEARNIKKDIRNGRFDLSPALYRE